MLKGAVMVMADLARALTLPVSMEFMAVSSYGSGMSTSPASCGSSRTSTATSPASDVLVVEDIIDSGLTLSWLLRNLRSRQPASVEVLRPAAQAGGGQGRRCRCKYMGFDIPSVFVVGYGLDYAERYRELPYVGTLRPEVYAG